MEIIFCDCKFLQQSFGKLSNVFPGTDVSNTHNIRKIKFPWKISFITYGEKTTRRVRLTYNKNWPRNQ